MTDRTRIISIRTLPMQLDEAHQKAFYHELESCINADRPAVVFDCSALRHLDKHSIHFLLCCLEEAMKRNGDIRLAAVQVEVKSVLKLTGLDSVFQFFDTIGEAVESYRVPRISLAPPSVSSTSKGPMQVNAA